MPTPSSSPPPPPPDSFACETQPTYTFPLHCKRSFYPTLTHQFKVEWPWPVAQPVADPHPKTVLSTPSTASSTGATSADAHTQRCEDAEGKTHTAAAPSPLWRDCRGCGVPTFIVDFSSDPFMDTLDTRRAGLLLSPGYRLLLPLTPLDPPTTLPDGAGLAFWKTVYRAPPEAAPEGAAPPYCAELVLGEVAALEKATRQWRKSGESAAAAPPQSSTVTGARSPVFTKISLPTHAPHEVEAVPAPPVQKTVQRCFFYTLPFRVRWLAQLRGRLVVTLPCEERVVTLHAPHHPTTTADPLIATAVVHSFSLPRGVVPLEVAEVLDRAVVAVGTYEHGVLLCRISRTTGAVEGVVQAVSLKGCGSAFFPVTRLAALFPPRCASSTRASEGTAAAAVTTTPSWVQRAADMESLCGGVLLCSSPYEPSATLVKLSGAAAAGTVEDFAATRGVETVLDVGPTVQPDLGPVFCTAARKVQWLRFLDSAEEAAKRAAVRAKRSDSGIAERVRPAVLCDRMARLDYPLMRLMASPPVLQSFAGKYVSRHSYTKHWRFGVDNRNRILLLDRTVSQYVFQSAFQLYRRDDAEQHAAPPGSVLPHRTTTAEGGATATVTVKTELKEDASGAPQPSAAEPEAATAEQAGIPPGTKRTRTAAAAAAARKTAKTPGRRSAKPPKASPPTTENGTAEIAAGAGVVGAAHAFACSVPREEACSGVVTIFAKDETIQVAAAHDRRYISVVTWRIGPPQTPPPPTSFFSPALMKEET